MLKIFTFKVSDDEHSIATHVWGPNNVTYNNDDDDNHSRSNDEHHILIIDQFMNVPNLTTPGRAGRAIEALIKVGGGIEENPIANLDSVTSLFSQQGSSQSQLPSLVPQSQPVLSVGSVGSGGTLRGFGAITGSSAESQSQVPPVPLFKWLVLAEQNMGIHVLNAILSMKLTESEIFGYFLDRAFTYVHFFDFFLSK